MTFILWMIVSAHMTFASTLSSADMFLLERAPEGMQDTFRIIEGEEAHAFEAVFGTSDMGKLIEIERDPVAYWEEREAALQGEMKSHIEFCKTYTEEAKAFIQDKGCKGGYHPWFFQDPNAIEDAIKTKIPAGDPTYHTALALYTAFACDHINNPLDESRNILQTRKNLLKNLDAFIDANKGFSQELNERMYWVIRDNAHFSIFDSLVALGKERYLCGAAPPEQRMHFKAHNFAFGKSRFFGYAGPILHDACSHAYEQHNLIWDLRLNRIPFKEYFGLCWSKDRLIKNNIFHLGEQSLGCYYNFHELPVAKREPGYSLDDLLFPKTYDLTDEGFHDITPYFIGQDSDFDWRQKEIIPYYGGDMHDSMLSLRDRFCRRAGGAMIQRTKTPS